jgi:hypothetical protein
VSRYRDAVEALRRSAANVLAQCGRVLAELEDESIKTEVAALGLGYTVEDLDRACREYVLAARPEVMIVGKDCEGVTR